MSETQHIELLMAPAEDEVCDCIASGNQLKPKQHGADPHAKNCAIYTGGRDDLGIDEQSMPTIEAPPQRLEMAPEYEPPAEQPSPLMQVLPADFPLPALIRFVPNPAIKEAIDQAASYALSVDVSGPEGLLRGDKALGALDDALKAGEAEFEDPAAIAFRLHREITGTRGKWLQPGADAKSTLGSRMFTERERLEKEAARVQRELQEEENRKAREAADREAAAAAKNKAPEKVVEQLRQEAKTAVAPPVPRPAAIAPPPMTASTPKVTWKSRIKGTPPEAEPNPDMNDLTPEQWAEVQQLLRDVADGKQPRACFDIGWSYLNGRAKSDESTMAITGMESYYEGGMKSKGSRRK